MILDNYNNATPPGTIAVLEIQTWGDYGDWTWRNGRFTFYSLLYTPTVWFDGAICVIDAITVDSAYAEYLSNYALRRAASTDVVMTLGSRQISEQTYEIKASVSVEAGGTTKTLRIYMVQALDYWPEPLIHTPRYGFVQAATPHGAEDVITVSPGDRRFVTHAFTFTGDSWANQNNIKILAWAQDSGSKNVYQAAAMGWPFVPFQLPGDMNGDGIVNVDDIEAFALALTNSAAYETQYPGIDLMEAGDTNHDGVFNGTDVQALVPLVINDHTPPTPNPMTWNASPGGIPRATSISAITMTATEAVDMSGVQYYFTATGVGAHSSDWQSWPTYTDTALQTNRSYSYKVKAQDLSPANNTTTDSTVVAVATFIETPTNLTVGAVTSNSIQVTAPGTFTRLAGNLSGLYFEVTDLAGLPVGGANANSWKQVQTIAATGLAAGTTYRFRVKARNYYGQNETSWYPVSGWITASTSP